MSASFRLGLVINPLAGVGGAVGLKGSDGVAEQALAMGAVPQAGHRTEQALSQLLVLQQQVIIKTAAGDMGQALAETMGFQTEICYQPKQHPTCAQDTEAAVQALVASGIDLLLFAGGDGTARNICQVLPEHVSALGIPAGCKIHSGVYAISPTAAGKLVASLVAGDLVSIKQADVMDIDEQAFRAGEVKARRFGELHIPAALQYVQSVKMGGKESEELVLDDLAAWVASQMEDDVRYVMGSGSTVAAVMAELGLDNTLLGVDVVENGELIAKDVTASQLLELVQDYPSRLIITLIGGQGHVFGRGNQQLSPAVIRAIGREHIWLIATKTKLQQLAGRPLLADTGDPRLDQELQGLLPVLTGYNDYVMYRLGE
ncbi:ATP-NAD kinase family protein [Alkalimonas collagenimarina]|uniref:ATP-NAD kinase family protein n=1 Tax=Alkalimonas collagenimarina TaxID=400390 RepID=A0ABT9GZF5_9GAMM|nr:ATP-NAD kinase family protein [Alkalimonas collagenimarina]MDP4536427.1 ATP-NAD kinase family protein [Alkalimonas collagenimarina]